MADAQDGITLEIIGADELQRQLRLFPGRVADRARRRGIRRAAARLRTLLRRESPNPQSKDLRKSIGVKHFRTFSSVGLTTRYYYKTLDLPSERGAPLNPWFEKAVDRHSATAAQLVIDETKKAIAHEAGKVYQKTKTAR